MSRQRRWSPGLLDQYALSWQTFLVVIPLSFVGVLTVVPQDSTLGTGVALLLMAGSLSTVALGCVMFLGRRTLRRFTGPVSLRVVTGLTLLLAGAARGLVVGLVFEAFAVHDRASLVVRSLSSALIFGLWLILIGALISSSMRYRAARSELLDEIVMRELQLRLLDDDRVLRQRGEVAARFVESTDAVRRMLDKADVDDEADYVELSAGLHRAVDERIRPLVHEMWSSGAPSVTDHRSTREFIRRAFLSRVPAAWAIAIYAAIATGAAMVTTSGAADIAIDWRVGLTAGIVETAIVALAILVERMVRPQPTYPSRWTLLLFLLVGPLLAGWIAVGSRVTGDISTFALLSFVGTAPVIVLAACAVQAVVDDRGRDLADLQLRLDRDEWAEQIELLESRAAGVDVASTVHNTLQARLVAAAMQLETAALRGDDDRARQALREARTALDAASLDSLTPSVPIEARAVAIAQAWQGIVEVVIVVGPGVAESPRVRLAGDAIEECVANSRRHAQASRVDVDLRLEGANLVLSVSDDGAAIDSDAVTGLGTAWMERVSEGRMTRGRVDGRNQVTMLIATT